MGQWVVRGGKSELFYKSKFLAKTILPEKGVNCNKCEFVTKRRKIYFTKSMGKIRLPHYHCPPNLSAKQSELTVRTKKPPAKEKTYDLREKLYFAQKLHKSCQNLPTIAKKNSQKLPK